MHILLEFLLMFYGVSYSFKQMFPVIVKYRDFWNFIKYIFKISKTMYIEKTLNSLLTFWLIFISL